MADLAKLAVEVTGKGIAQVKRGLDQLGNAAKKTESAAGKLTSEFVNMKTAAGALVGALAVREIAMVGSAFVQAASEAAETQNKFSVVFSSIQEDAEKTAQTLQYAYGMSNQAAKESLSAVGDLLTGLGVQQDTALSLAEQTVQLGTDLASFTNYAGGAQGATEALTKAMLGETEQAKSLGLVLLETPTKAYAESLGYVWENLTLAEKAQVRLNFAMTQSPNAIGDFARSSLELANQLRIADGVVKDMRVNVGEGLLPVVKESVQAFTGSREELNNFSLVVGNVFAANLGSARGILKDFVDDTGKLKEGKLSETFLQATGAVKVLMGSVSSLKATFASLWDSAKLGGNLVSGVFRAIYENVVKLNKDKATNIFNKAVADFAAGWDKENKEFEESLYKSVLTTREGLRYLENPGKELARIMGEIGDKAEESGEKTKKAFSNATGGGTTSGGATQVKGYEKAVQDLQDRLFELTHTAQQNEIYQVQQWYNAKAAITGYTDELVKARDIEMQQVIKKYDDKDAEAKKKLQAEINRSILQNEQTSAYARQKIVEAEYESKIAAAEKYKLDVVGLEAEKSLKIKAIWDAEAKKNGSMYDGFISGLEAYGDSAASNFQRAETAGLTMARSLESGIGAMLSTSTSGFKDFGQTAISILNSVIDAAMQAAVIQPLAQGLVSMAGTVFSSWGGGSTGGGDVSWMNNQTWSRPSAKGNVFSGGNISDYSGTIVSSPTFFSGGHNKAYAKGGNVMGEAGPEAILPLRRTSGGRLGVEVTGGSKGSTTIVINNYGPPMEAEKEDEKKDQQGNITMEVILKPIKEAVAKDIATYGTNLNRAVKHGTGQNNGYSSGLGSSI